MPLDPQAEAFLNAVPASVSSIQEMTVAESRELVEAQALELFGEPERVEVVIDHRIPGCDTRIPIRIYRPSPEVPFLPGLVYFHGGGWVVGNLDTHDGVCHTLAKRLAVGGDSAGGGLAAAVALRARDRGLPLRFQLLVYPVVDYQFDTASYLEFAEGFGLTREAMRAYWGHYVRSESDGLHPEASVLRAADLAGVAPALVQTAEFDVLRDEGEAYAERLRDAGVDVLLTRYDGLIHGFFRMPAVLDRSEEALNEAASLLRARLT